MPVAKFSAAGPDPAQAIVGGILYLVKGVIDIGVSIFLSSAPPKEAARARCAGHGQRSSPCVPCTAPCCVLVGMGFGIWALVVLCDANVKSAFRS